MMTSKVMIRMRGLKERKKEEKTIIRVERIGCIKAPP